MNKECHDPGAINPRVVEDRIFTIASATTPSISNLNVQKSNKVHIGPKFVSVTQNIENAEVVKGRMLGLELVSRTNARRVRCSVAVFICWAFLVASGIAIYLIYMTHFNHFSRLDIDLSCPKYLWDIVKNSSRTEKVSCAAALLALLTCVALIINFTVQSKAVDQYVDKAPHEWYITREMWLAKPYNLTNRIVDHFEPLWLVVVQHTVSTSCTKFLLCAAELRNIQGYFIKDFDYDIPYNFVIGNDGRVYEGRGWRMEGAHTYRYNRCTLGIGFIGDYREEVPYHSKVTPAQLNRTRMLLDEGVKLGYLRRDFQVVGARDVTDTFPCSPGSNLYNELKKWPNYDHKNRFKNMNCEMMYDKFGNESFLDNN